MNAAEAEWMVEITLARAQEMRAENKRLRAENERLRELLYVVEAADDGTLVFECADCGDRWDEDDLVQVQPDGRLACPSLCHDDDGGGTTFTMLRDLGPISTWPNVFGSSEEVDRG